MPITPTDPFKGRHYPGEVIVLCVRWYLRYPLAYEHVSEILAERGVEVDPSCIWRWVQAYAPELDKRCRPHLKPTNKSYRIDETYIKGQRPRTSICIERSTPWARIDFSAHRAKGRSIGQAVPPKGSGGIRQCRAAGPERRQEPSISCCRRKAESGRGARSPCSPAAM